MTIQLGALLLPASIQWTDRWEWSPVAQETTRTLGGSMVIWTQPIHAGRPITLVAEDGVTWLTTAQVQSILAMADQPGAIFSFSADGFGANVIFRHQDQPATTFRPIMPHHDFHVGTIKLITC